MMFASPGSERTGEPVPPYDFTDTRGNKINTTNTAGKVVVLNFWFATCKPCIEELPDLNQVYTEYAANPDVLFAAVTFESSERTETFLKKFEFRYPLVTDAQSVIKQFGVNGYPTNLVIGRDGKISSFVVGGFPGIGEALKAAIDQALESE